MTDREDTMLLQRLPLADADVSAIGDGDVIQERMPKIAPACTNRRVSPESSALGPIETMRTDVVNPGHGAPWLHVIVASASTDGYRGEANMSYGPANVTRTLVIGVWALACLLAGCRAPRQQRLDFTGLTPANRIEARGITRSLTITDRAAVQAAVRFVQRKRDGWTESLGSAGGLMQLEFYNNADFLGGYAIAPSNISIGTLHQPVPEQEVSTLMGQLGLSWK